MTHGLAGILLVDDDRISTFLTQRLLRQQVPAVRLLVADNGAEGLQRLQHVLAGPDSAGAGSWLVLLDVKMPVLDGLGFLQAYQQLPSTQRQRVAVVVLTTTVHFYDLERLQQLPIAGVVTKPLTEEEVKALLRENLPGPPAPRLEAASRVFRLAYHSQAAWELTEAELHVLLNQARHVNAARQLTGVLVYRAGSYVQVLEGPEAAVRAVYARIAQDERHTNVVTVHEATHCPRHFGYWHMALGRTSAPAVARLFEAMVTYASVDEALLHEAGVALAHPLT